MAQFSANQAAFLKAFTGASGINPGVAAAWMAAEEPVGAHAGYQGTQDWLNVGITDSGPRGAGNAVWQNPTQAGLRTAQWLKGQWTDPGFGKAAPGIQAITRASDPQSQIQAIQHSGWASSGYPDLPSLYNTYGSLGHQVVGMSGPTANMGANSSSMGATSIKLPGQPNTQITNTYRTPNWHEAGVQAFLNAAPHLPTDQYGNPVVGTSTGALGKLADYATKDTNVTKVTTGSPGTASRNIAFPGVTTRAVADAANAGVNPDAQKLLNMLHTVNGAPYNQGNHNAVAEHHGAISSQGTDCSGLVSWLMGPHGLGIWDASQTTPTITSAPGMQRGPGHTITVYDNPQAGNAGHVFIEVNMGGTRQYWASEGGVGVHQLPMSEVQNYLANGSDGGHYVALHPKGL